MCNVLVASTIIEALTEAVKNLEVFTAFDITIAARALTSDNVVHNDVRSIIENEFVTQQLVGYDRQLCVLNLSNSPQAQVYFPDTKSANDHSLVTVTPVTPAPSGSLPATAPVDLADDEVKTTKEGRVQIPRKLLSQVTAAAGSYDICVGGETKYAQADARGDVRVCLGQFDIHDAKVRVTVDTTNNTINIETV